MKSFGYIFGYALALSSAGLIFGFNLSIFNTFFPYFIKKFKHIEPRNYQDVMTNLNLSFVLGGIAACALGSPIYTFLGRYQSVIFILIIEIISIALMVVRNIWLIITIRFVIGFVCCFWTFLIPVAIRESFSFKFTNWFAPLFSIFVSLGALLSLFFGYSWAEKCWELILILLFILEIIKLRFFFNFKMESPVWLSQKNASIQQHINNFEFLYSTKDATRLALNIIKQKASINKVTKVSFKEIFSRRYFLRIFVAVLLNCMARLTGINIFTFYSRLLFEQMNFKNPVNLSITLGILNLISCSILPFVINRLGKKFIISLGFLSQTLSYSIILGGNFLNNNIIKATGIFFYIFSYSISMGGLINVYCADVAPSNILSFCAFSQWVLMAVFATSTLKIMENFQIYNIFFTFQLITTLGGILFIGFGVETTNKKDNDIFQEFSEKGFFTY